VHTAKQSAPEQLSNSYCHVRTTRITIISNNHAAFSSHNPTNHWTPKHMADNTRYNKDRTDKSTTTWNTDTTVSQGYEVNTLTWCFVIIRQLVFIITSITCYWIHNDWLSCCSTSHSIQNRSSWHVLQANLLAWYGKTKTNNKSTHSPVKRNVIKHKTKHKKTKATFSRLLRHPVWKQWGHILVLALHKFLTL